MLDLNALEARLDIARVFRDRGFQFEVKENGFSLPCPFYPGRYPTLFVSLRTRTWQCFDCRKSGNIFRFISELNGGDPHCIAEALRQRYFPDESFLFIDPRGA